MHKLSSEIKLKKTQNKTEEKQETSFVMSMLVLDWGKFSECVPRIHYVLRKHKILWDLFIYFVFTQDECDDPLTSLTNTSLYATS